MRYSLFVIVYLVLLSGCGGRPWSYVDRSGKLITSESFTEVHPFSEGLGSVRVGGKAGFIDKTGKWIIKPIFDSAGSFHEGLATASKNGKLGYINRAGEFVIQPKFQYASEFSEGLAYVIESDHSAKASAVEIWVKNQGDENSQRGFIDKFGNFVIKLPKGFYSSTFQEGLAPIIELNGNPRKYGYAGSGGIVTLTNDKPGKYGYIDKVGRIVIPIKFGIHPYQTYDFHEDLALISTDEGFGFIDQSGKIIIKPRFYPSTTKGGFSNELAPMRLKQDNCTDNNVDNDINCEVFINRKGEVVIKPNTEPQYVRPFSEGLAAVAQNKSWGYINRSGKFSIKPRFHDASEFKEGLAKVKLDNQRAAYINKTGKIIFTLPYVDTGDFSEGIAAACLFSYCDP